MFRKIRKYFIINNTTITTITKCYNINIEIGQSFTSFVSCFRKTNNANFAILDYVRYYKVDQVRAHCKGSRTPSIILLNMFCITYLSRTTETKDPAIYMQIVFWTFQFKGLYYFHKFYKYIFILFHAIATHFAFYKY